MAYGMLSSWHMVSSPHKPLTPDMANVLAAIKDLSAKVRYGKRIPADIVDSTYYARAVRGLIDRGLLVLKSNSTHEDWWYEVVS